ncbi:histidine kinase [Burkholderia sp. SRS-W-2-2016]|uniref:GAF domain-containing protein n=1 Tax=Burkholderia sp. SRS-W-2-2016 TaxID=1926878 RepID=UPI00094AEF8E|nr:GAF domain-containing protein [Burkholderia sp. SRS-W-2-2016]OLL31720.1 histidine kinase [Burkholderia sp. SRS-W-2-2016]
MQPMQLNPTVPATSDTQAIGVADLERLAMAIRMDDQPLELFRAVHAVAASTIGLSLITIMCYDAQRQEVERVYSNMPDVYPLGGRKKKQGTAWAKQILQDLKPFRATTSQGIREAFDDHAVMNDLGLGSILNIPIAYDGVCIGTMNLTHKEGWYRSDHERVGLLIGAFLVPALLKQISGLSAGIALS